MKIVFWGKGERGVGCLKALLTERHAVPLVAAQPEDSLFASAARGLGLEVIEPEDPNTRTVCRMLEGQGADLFVFAGYGKIVNADVIRIPRKLCLNLHAGKLPEYRGSSPLNWALINGEKSFALTVIKLDKGVDSGDILLEKSFRILPGDTIRDLHETANREFPKLLLEGLKKIRKGNYRLKRQNPGKVSYYPLRFPEDGFVVWDIQSALEIHNRIRALTDPYPGAFTFWNGRKVKLPASELTAAPFFGEPGRIYRKSGKGLLVCARDRCLWIQEARFEDTGESVEGEVGRYDRFATVRGLLQSSCRDILIR